MSERQVSLLDKLKTKTEPKSEQKKEVKQKAKIKSDITLKTNIVDNTGQIDRNEFLKKIGKKPILLDKSKERIPDLEEVEEEKPIEEPIDKPGSEKPDDEPDDEPDVEPEEEPIEEPVEEPDSEKPADEPEEEPIEEPDSKKKPEDEQEEKELPSSSSQIKKITFTRKAKDKTSRATRKITAPSSVPLTEQDLFDIEQLKAQVPEKVNIKLKASSYYLNNREIFINFINSLLEPYKKEIEKEMASYNCEGKDGEFSLLTHQSIVRDYINLIAPYRGLLLYHGLGSGKTCSSIAIAEGIKTDKEVIIMLPASLETNYKQELKKCGDDLFKKTQHWEFIDTVKNKNLITPLSNILSLSEEFIISNKGAWFINKDKTPNYNLLSASQITSLNKQVDKMISNKYTFLRYNGLRQRMIDELVAKAGGNPFDNKVIVIDEAHNLISKIVNQLNKKNSLFFQIYNYLKSAKNARIVMLTGTPVINYPNEIGIMMNILRGNIVTWNLKLINEGKFKLTQESLIELFKVNLQTKSIFDYVKFKSSPEPTLTITKNPFGFSTVNEEGEYKGVKRSESGEIDDVTFINQISDVLLTNGIKIEPNSLIETENKCLPDGKDDFNSYFIDIQKISKNITMKNMDLFKRRILGLVSYFPDIDFLLPKFDKATDFQLILVPMSDYQFGIYEEARVQERKIERNNAKKKAQANQVNKLYDESVSTYRVFSRACCNFVFPKEAIPRPLPNDGKNLSTEIMEDADEDLLDAEEPSETVDISVDQTTDIKPMTAQVQKRKANLEYKLRIQDVVRKLRDRKDEFLVPSALEIYSAKFLNILSRILDEKYKGLHLIYSQFRSLEGIGIMALVLEANGFAQFKISKVESGWKINIKPEDLSKPKFILYTGTENVEEKEIMRDIFNSNWKNLPNNLQRELENINENNFFGEIIKVIMITASGAEGISLSNVRYVHITEPYWHPVRIEQVIGRARRICSHNRLEKEFQTVEVFLYLMEFTEKQYETASRELKLQDQSKLNKTEYMKYKSIDNSALTSDQALFEISNKKQKINYNLLQNLKEASIDCNIHNKIDTPNELKCFSFGSVKPYKFAYSPQIEGDEKDETLNMNKKEEKVKIKKVKLEGKEYAFQEPDKEKEVNKDGLIETPIFTIESVKTSQPVQIGILYFSKDLKAKSFNFFGR